MGADIVSWTLSLHLSDLLLIPQYPIWSLEFNQNSSVSTDQEVKSWALPILPKPAPHKRQLNGWGWEIVGEERKPLGRQLFLCVLIPAQTEDSEQVLIQKNVSWDYGKPKGQSAAGILPQRRPWNIIEQQVPERGHRWQVAAADFRPKRYTLDKE